MLVLSRKQQEKIKIGDDIVVTILKTKGKTVRLGIEAPNDVSVLRGELAFDMPTADEAAAFDDGDHQPQPEPTPQVTHARVPRQSTNRVLPALLDGQAPLRQFLASAKSDLVC